MDVLRVYVCLVCCRLSSRIRLVTTSDFVDRLEACKVEEGVRNCDSENQHVDRRIGLPPSRFSYDQVQTSMIMKLSSLTRISSETQACLNKGQRVFLVSAFRIAVS